MNIRKCEQIVGVAHVTVAAATVVPLCASHTMQYHTLAQRSVRALGVRKQRGWGGDYWEAQSHILCMFGWFVV